MFEKSLSEYIEIVKMGIYIYIRLFNTKNRAPEGLLKDSLERDTLEYGIRDRTLE
jgi:hypothetical protein